MTIDSRHDPDDPPRGAFPTDVVDLGTSLDAHPRLLLISLE